MLHTGEYNIRIVCKLLIKQKSSLELWLPRVLIAANLNIKGRMARATVFKRSFSRVQSQAYRQRTYTDAFAHCSGDGKRNAFIL